MTISDSDEFTIIVVDSGDLSRHRTVQILEENGFNVVAQAKSATEAVQFITSNIAKLYIIDILMPTISGLDLIKIMNKKKTSAHIIVTSTIPSDSLRVTAFTNRAFDFLDKPISKRELIKSVRKVKQLYGQECSET